MPIAQFNTQQLVSASAGGSGITIRGGDNIRRFIVRISNPVESAKIVARVLRKRFLPFLRMLVPRRTGRLLRTLRIRRLGHIVRLEAVWYANMIRTKGQGQSIAQLAYQVLNDQLNGILTDLRKEIEALV